MRDDGRIYRFCKILQDGWKKVPDLRFGQMMQNFFHSECNSDPFYIEDDELFEKFSKYIENISKQNSI